VRALGVMKILLYLSVLIFWIRACPIPLVCSPPVLFAQDVIITEIMYHPFPGEGEWIEIFNNSPFPIGLTGWHIGDQQKPMNASLPSYMLAPRSYLVIGDDRFPLNRFGSAPVIILDSGFPRLNNSGDVILIFDEAGNVADRIAYLPTWGGEVGRSLEKINIVAAGDRQDNWGSSVNPAGGTPGFVNSIYGNPSQSGLVVDVSPNPFRATEEGCLIRYQSASSKNTYPWFQFILNL